MSAKEAYLRASNYYRFAEFFIIDPHDVRSLQTWRLSKECFSQATKHFTCTFKPLHIPYEQTKLPGYFFKANDYYNNKIKKKSRDQ